MTTSVITWAEIEGQGGIAIIKDEDLCELLDWARAHPGTHLATDLRDALEARHGILTTEVGGGMIAHSYDRPGSDEELAAWHDRLHAAHAIIRRVLEIQDEDGCEIDGPA